jgi:hypothetical protein
MFPAPMIPMRMVFSLCCVRAVFPALVSEGGVEERLTGELGPVGDRDPDVPDASHHELLSGRLVRF